MPIEGLTRFFTMLAYPPLVAYSDLLPVRAVRHLWRQIIESDEGLVGAVPGDCRSVVDAVNRPALF
jgi:hypothetical protein